MAFFGLTALGYQNPFLVPAIDYPLVHIFSDLDYKSAWEAVNGDAMIASKSSLVEILKVLFRGPVTDTDTTLVNNAFLDEFEEIDFKLYMSKMVGLREYLIEEEKKKDVRPRATCDVISSLDHKERMKRNIRYERAPFEKQKNPVTASQEYGWEHQELNPPVAGRKDSPITKFASELVKNGVYY